MRTYNMVWVLEDDNGERWTEKHMGISLNDFDVIYSMNVYKIVTVGMVLVG